MSKSKTKRDMDRILKSYMRIRQKMNNFLLQFEEEKVQERKKSCIRFVVKSLEREIVHSL